MGRSSSAVLARPALDPASTRFAAAAALLIVAGGLVAAVNGAAPFARGSWLAAYLVLVGGVSQAALGVGALWLRRPLPSAHVRGAQLLLWNAGGLTVPAGVLAGATAIVWAGSAVLLAALACFAANAVTAPPRADRPTVVYGGLIGALASSVAAGCALAGVAS